MTPLPQNGKLHLGKLQSNRQHDREMKGVNDERESGRRAEKTGDDRRRERGIECCIERMKKI